MSRHAQIQLQRLLTAALCALFAAFFAASFSTSHTVQAATGPFADKVLDYADPVELLFSSDGTRLYVLCQQSGEVRVLNAATYALIKTIVVGHVPRGFSLSADGTRLFVANSWDDTISVIDTSALDIIATWQVSMEPTSVVENRAGNHLFVANRVSNDVAVLNPRTGAEEKRLAGGRGASYMTLSPDASRLYVTSIYPNATPWRTPPNSEITIIGTAKAEVVDRIPLRSIAGVFHVALSADGRLGAVAELHPKNLVPLTTLEHGAGDVTSIV